MFYPLLQILHQPFRISALMIRRPSSNSVLEEMVPRKILVDLEPGVIHGTLEVLAQPPQPTKPTISPRRIKRMQTVVLPTIILGR